MIHIFFTLILFIHVFLYLTSLTFFCMLHFPFITVYICFVHMYCFEPTNSTLSQVFFFVFYFLCFFQWLLSLFHHPSIENCGHLFQCPHCNSWCETQQKQHTRIPIWDRFLSIFHQFFFIFIGFAMFLSLCFMEFTLNGFCLLPLLLSTVLLLRNLFFEHPTPATIYWQSLMFWFDFLLLSSPTHAHISVTSGKKKLSRTYPLDCAQGPDNKKFLHETNTGMQYTCTSTTKDHSIYISSSEISYKVNTSISFLKLKITQIQAISKQNTKEKNHCPTQLDKLKWLLWRRSLVPSGSSNAIERIIWLLS